MYGFEAISEAHGWQMAALGVTIVFLSLMVLAIIISQLHIFLDLWEKRKAPAETTPENQSNTCLAGVPSALSHPFFCPEDINMVIAIWTPLVQQLNDPFQLIDLFKKASENSFPHPHLTINRLRQAGIIVPVEDCLFSWNVNTEDENHG